MFCEILNAITTAAAGIDGIRTAQIYTDNFTGGRIITEPAVFVEFAGDEIPRTSISKTAWRDTVGINLYVTVKTVSDIDGRPNGDTIGELDQYTEEVISAAQNLNIPGWSPVKIPGIRLMQQYPGFLVNRVRIELRRTVGNR